MRQARSFEDVLFKRAVVISVFFHLALYICSIYLPSIPFLKGKRGELKYTPTVRVDLVALPDKPYREMKEMDEVIQKTGDAIQEIKKQRAELTLQEKKGAKLGKGIPLKKETTSAIERLRALQNLEKRLRLVKKDAERKGNRVTPGASLPSSGKENVLDEYRSVVVEKIKLRWSLPSYLRKQEALSGEMIIFLNPDGGVIRKEIVSSGVQEFDGYMNQALEEALPFPAVPEALRRELRYDGVSITFVAGELR